MTDKETPMNATYRKPDGHFDMNAIRAEVARRRAEKAGKAVKENVVYVEWKKGVDTTQSTDATLYSFKTVNDLMEAVGTPSDDDTL